MQNHKEWAAATLHLNLNPLPFPLSPVLHLCNSKELVTGTRDALAAVATELMHSKTWGLDVIDGGNNALSFPSPRAHTHTHTNGCLKTHTCEGPTQFQQRIINSQYETDLRRCALRLSCERRDRSRGAAMLLTPSKHEKVYKHTATHGFTRCAHIDAIITRSAGL